MKIASPCPTFKKTTVRTPLLDSLITACQTKIFSKRRAIAIFVPKPEKIMEKLYPKRSLQSDRMSSLFFLFPPLLRRSSLRAKEQRRWPWPEDFSLFPVKCQLFMSVEGSSFVTFVFFPPASVGAPTEASESLICVLYQQANS